MPLVKTYNQQEIYLYNKNLKYINKFVITNKGYQNLPERSYGFEELL